MTWGDEAKKAMQDNPDYFVWWYTVKSVGLGVVAAVAAYYIGKDVSRRSRGTFNGLLGALPKKGHIPASSVAYAMSHLKRQVDRCGITATQLREGMEVEREHGDVTRRGAVKTAKIAAAHICERPDYYKRLKKYVE